VAKRGLVAVLLAAAIVSFAGACTKAQERQINVAFAAPPVDLRAVAGGVEVGFVCGPGVPIGTFLEAEHPPYNHQTRDLPKGAKPTRSIVIPVPDVLRTVPVDGTVMLTSPFQRGVPFGMYRFTFRYSALPHTTTRIPGGSCNRQVIPTPSNSTAPSSTTLSAVTAVPSTAAPTTTLQTAAPSVPPTEPSTAARQNYCDLAVTWTPRDARGFTQFTLHVTSDEQARSEVQATISQNGSTYTATWAGQADTQGSATVVGTVGGETQFHGAVTFLVKVAGIQLAQCRLASTVPA
jgi:hypothetical protein